MPSSCRFRDGGAAQTATASAGRRLSSESRVGSSTTGFSRMRAPSSATTSADSPWTTAPTRRAVLGQVEADETAVRERAAKHAVDGGLDVAEHLELAIEELREEDRQLVVCLVRACELAAEVRALRVRVRPVLDPPHAARGRVRVPGDVADRVHVRERGAEPLVDDDSVLDVRAGVLRQLDVRHDADADDREEALDRPAVRRPRPGQQASVARELLELGLEQDLDALAPVELHELRRQVGAAELRHQGLAHLHDGHLEAAHPQRGRGLGADEAAADHDRGVRVLGRLDDRLGVAQRAIRVDAHEVCARERELPRSRAGCDDERPVGDALAAGELDLVRVRVDPLGRRLETKLDHVVLVLVRRPDEWPVAVHLPAQEPLRERRAVVRRVGLGGEDRHRCLASRRAVLGREPRGREASTDDHDWIDRHHL